MAEAGGVSLLARRGLYLVVASVMVLGAMVPLAAIPRAVPPPEMLLALTLAWIVRRPREVPLISVAVVFVAADLLLQRPPGLHAALVIGATEWLRARPARLSGFVAEWPLAAGLILVVAVAEQAVLTASLAGAPAQGPAAARALLTAAAYPAAVLAASWLLGARRAPRGAGDAGTAAA